VVKHKQLIEWLSRYQNSPVKPLPRGVSMRIALRRSIRVGKHAGRPLEELGIEPDLRHYLTRDDVLNGNRDLIRHASAILKTKPVYGLSIDMKRNSDRSRTIYAATKNISRLDIYLGDRPLASLDIEENGTAAIENIPQPGSPGPVRIEGYDFGGKLVAGWLDR